MYEIHVSFAIHVCLTLLLIAVCVYLQWYDALKAVARLPAGIPKEWRKRVWVLNIVLFLQYMRYLHSV